ncbi:MAG: hypothetical protein AAF411_22345 [Myxococcota bacterium]
MVSFRGGSRVGMVNASWPFAELSVEADQIVLKAAFTTLRFAPEDVAALEHVQWMPLLAQGVQIRHTRDDIPDRVIFWAFRPKRVLEAIANAGFTPKADPVDVPPKQPFPFRIPFLVAVGLAWNALLIPAIGLLDGRMNTAFDSALFIAAPAMLALVCLSILLPTPFRTLALRPGVPVSRVRHVLLLVLFIASVMTVGSAVAFLA